jgi:serine/threonine protein kinase/TPR repeat protein
MVTTKEIFISCSPRDEQIAQAACQALESGGHSCWIASRDLNSGLSAFGQAMQALRETRAVVLFLSEHSIASPDVLRVIEFAARQRQPIVSVRLDGTEWNGDFTRLLWECYKVDATKGNSDTERIASLIPEVEKALSIRPMAPVTEPESSPIRFGDFEILVDQQGRLEQLGKGGMGVTYKARQISLNRTVALKVITPELLGDQDVQQRFLREALTAAKIDHPNVATVYARGQEGDAYFYAMQFVDGVDLERYLRANGPLSIAQTLSVASQVAQALEAANTIGLIHRDVKPSNIMAIKSRRESLRIKLIDFGLAKNINPLSGESSFSSRNAVIGTLAFASPEQCRTAALDTRSDLYSLGVTLWYLLTGNLPFRGTAIEISGSHLYQEPPFTVLKDFPNGIVDLLRRLLAKDPAKRPQSPTELEELVEQLQTNLSPEILTAGFATTRIVTETAKPEFNQGTQSLIGSRAFQSYLAPKSHTTSDAHYLLLEEVREGIGGRLFRARDQQSIDRREFGIKYLHPEILANDESRELVVQQVRHIQRSPHQNLVRYHSVELAAASPFLVREWVHGFSLDSLLRWKQHLEPWELSALFEPLPSLLDRVSHEQFVLLQLSVAKLFLSLPNEIPAEQFPSLVKANGTDLSTAQLKLNPLSLGRLVRSTGSSSSSYGEQTVISTSRVMALKQANHNLRPKAPVQLLSHLIYESLTGHPPPEAYLHGDYRPISILNETGNQVLRRACIQASSETRFTNCTEFWTALRPELIGRAPRPVLPLTSSTVSTPDFATRNLADEAAERQRGAKSDHKSDVVQSNAGIAGPAPATNKVTPSESPSTANRKPKPGPKTVHIVLAAAGVFAALIALFLLTFALRILPGPAPVAVLPAATATPTPQPSIAESTPTATPTATPTPDLFAKAQALLDAHDYENASPLLTGAATAGNRDAMRLLGDLYFDGKGYKKDDQRAANWYQKAATAGDPTAMADLAFLYENGKGVPQDYDQAHYWYTKAAAAGEAHAMYRLGKFYEDGVNVQQDYRKAREWYQKAAEAGDVEAMFSLAGFYHHSNGGKKDDALAFQWYLKAANAGHIDAMANLAALYEKGWGVQQDYAEARKWYQKAADAGSPDAKRHLEALPQSK